MFLLCLFGIRRMIFEDLKNFYEYVQYDCKNDILKFGKQFMKMNCYRVLVDFRDFYDFEFIDGEF